MIDTERQALARVLQVYVDYLLAAEVPRFF